MFNIIEIYRVKTKYVINSTINTTSLPIAIAMKLSGNTYTCFHRSVLPEFVTGESKAFSKDYGNFSAELAHLLGKTGDLV